MTKISKTLAMTLVVLFCSGSAWAFSIVTWDLSLINAKVLYAGSGGPVSTISFNDAMVISNVGNPAEVTQEFGPDYTLGNDDPFKESGIIGLIAKGTPQAPVGLSFYDATDLASSIYTDIYIYYTFNDLTGKVVNFTSTSDFDLLFDAGVGTIDLWYGYDTISSNALGNLASFELIRGEGSSFNLNAGAGNNADFSFTLKFLSALSGFWSIDGEDATTLINDGLFAYADLNSRLTGQTPILENILDVNGNPILGQDGKPLQRPTGLNLLVENSGTMRHAPVPEPSTMLLLGAGLLGLGALARRRR